MSVVIKSQVVENSPAVLLRRVAGSNGVNLTQSDVTSISVKVYNALDASLVATVTPTVSSSVYNTLQTDSRWTEDATGYNVALSLAGTCWPEVGTYQVEALITPVSGNPFYLLWQLEAVNIFSA